LPDRRPYDMVSAVPGDALQPEPAHRLPGSPRPATEKPSRARTCCFRPAGRACANPGRHERTGRGAGGVVPNACPRPGRAYTAWQQICRSAGRCTDEQPRPLKAVAPVRIRSGLPQRTSTTRPLSCANEAPGPCCVSDQVRPGPAVGGHLCPIRARVAARCRRQRARARPRRAAVEPVDNAMPCRGRSPAAPGPGPSAATTFAPFRREAVYEGSDSGCRQ
jgi:hypothetical protein